GPLRGPRHPLPQRGEGENRGRSHSLASPALYHLVLPSPNWTLAFPPSAGGKYKRVSPVSPGDAHTLLTASHFPSGGTLMYDTAHEPPRWVRRILGRPVSRESAVFLLMVWEVLTLIVAIIPAIAVIGSLIDGWAHTWSTTETVLTLLVAVFVAI